MMETSDSIDPVSPPTAAHLPSKADELLRTHDDRDAQELQPLDGHAESPPRPASIASTAEDIWPRRRSHIRPVRSADAGSTWYTKLAQQWERHVSVKVPVAARRDHLALERTFLGYLRTSVAFSMLGVIIAQLFRLNTAPLPGGRIGYYRIGVPLAAAFISSAIAVLLLGAIRFWRQQAAMTKGKIHVGGWEMLLIMAISVLVSWNASP